MDSMDEQLLLRRTVLDDIDAIYSLIRRDITMIFGRVRILNLVEKTLLSFTVTGGNNRIVAFACFSDYPNFSKECDEDINWLEWMHSHFEVEESANYLNSFFLWYFAAEEGLSVDAARLLMKELYNCVPFLQNCFLICPTGVPLNEALITVFYPLANKLEFNKSWRGFVGKREHHNKLLHVREARVEDNDDLIPLFDEMGESLRQKHGEYFVAEFVKNQTEHRRCLVAEVEGVAVGFMSINADLDIDILNDLYDLDSFNGLRNTHPDDVVFNVWKKEGEGGREDGGGEGREGGGEGGGEKRKVTKKDEKEEEEDEEEEEEEEEKEGDRTASSFPAKVLLKASRSYVRALTIDTKATLTGSSSLGLSPTYDSTSDLSTLRNDTTSTPLDQLTEEELARVFGASGGRDGGSEVGVANSQYYGDASCVCVELYAISEQFSTRAGAFLLKIFETFPHKTYCVINLPYLVPEPPLLQYFTRVTPLMKKNPPNVLYVFASPGVLDNISIRLATAADLPQMLQPLAALADGVEVLKDLEYVLDFGADEEKVEMRCYVADLEGQIVGIAVIKMEEDIEYIRSHYNIEHFVEYHQHRRVDYKHLVHFVMNPAFNHYDTFFLQELLRESRTSNLCYYYHPAHSVGDFKAIGSEGDNRLHRPKNTISTVINVMIPVSARRQIQYNLDRLAGNAPSVKVTREMEPFHLMFISRKNIMDPRVSINARIVVVGASDTAIAFLETFVYNPKLKFNNLTLISTNGLPGDLPYSKVRSLLLSHNHCYSYKNMAEMGLRVWCNVVVGKMTALDREEKVITVDSSRYVNYDYLFLTTGIQYIAVKPPSVEGERPGSSIRKSRGKSTSSVAKGVFVINDERDATAVLKYVHNNVARTEKIVIHGSTLDAYCCLHGLLTSRVPAKKIVFAVPPLDDDVTCINNVDIDCDLIKNLKAIEGLKVMRDVKMEGWKLKSKKELSGVIFSGDGGNYTKLVHCKALITYTHKGVDHEAFHAINCSTLVFDRRLTIDASFRTNDPSIWAAGPLTKYQRSYYCGAYNHSINNSKEIGYSLANSVMYLFDPVNHPKPPTPQTPKLTPTYIWPKIRAGVLPGNFHYLHIHKPSLEVALKVAEKKAEYGHLLKTGTAGDANDHYFRLHINQLGFVETVTCYSKKEIVSNNLICLYGLHHKYLNNVVGRWYEGLIKDLYVFLNEPWANILYHDRFIDLREEVRERVLSRYSVGSSGNTESLDEFLRKHLDEQLELENSRHKEMQALFRANAYDKKAQRLLANYLVSNHHHLPMYVRSL